MFNFSPTTVCFHFISCLARALTICLLFFLARSLAHFDMIVHDVFSVTTNLLRFFFFFFISRIWGIQNVKKTAGEEKRSASKRYSIQIIQLLNGIEGIAICSCQNRNIQNWLIKIWRDLYVESFINNEFPLNRFNGHSAF